MTQYRLQIYTQEKKVFDDQVVSIVVPAQTGYLGILANHAPMVALLGKGSLRVQGQMGQSYFDIDGGLLEVRHNVATLLIDRLSTEVAA